MKTHRILGLVIVAAALLTTSCVTAPKGMFRIEPNEKYTKLLIGSIQYEAHGWGYNLDGTFYLGLTLLIQNLDTKKEYYLQQSAVEKFFYISSIEPGKYRVVKAVYKNTDGSSLTRTIRRFDFVVDDGLITNMGLINWLSDKTNGNYSFNTVGDHELVKERFASRFPQSKWLEMDWKAIPIVF